jgi:hypothetical protein
MREQADALREAINRRAICVYVGASLGYIEIPAWSGPPLLISASQINDCRDMVQTLMETYGVPASSQKRFLDTSIYPDGDIEGHDPGDGPWPGQGPAESVTLAGLKASIPIGDGSDFTNVPDRNPWGLSESYGQALPANTARFKEHVNELHSLMLGTQYAIFGSGGFTNSTFSINGTSTVGTSVQVTAFSFAAHWDAVAGARARLYVRFRDHANWTSSVVARDSQFHYVEDITLGAAFSSSTLGTWEDGSPVPSAYRVGAIVVDMEQAANG